MSESPDVLVIDDDVNVQRGLMTALAPTCSVRIASCGEEGLSEFERRRPDVVLLDVMLPHMSGLAVLRALKKQRGDQPVIMMTGFAEVQTAVQAIKLGALDYLQKPIDPAAVLQQITQTVAHGSSERDSIRARIVGHSAAIRRVWRLVEQFGPTDIPILLQGETGTGKGLVAEAIHQVSKRASGPLVAIDCATLPDQLAESELFGYEDGAFTGAGKRKRGRVAFADRGTLFLDEIGTLAVATQAKLLTLVEQQNFMPLGARNYQPTHVDIRFVSATNLPLQDAVAEGTFRADLFHRLNGVIVQLPALGERREDIASLAKHFIGEFGRRAGKPDLTIAEDALELLENYHWPGNVRQLQRVISVAVVLADTTITTAEIPEHVHRDNSAAPTAQETDAPLNLREIKERAGREAQKLVIMELRKRTNISRQDLARMLGVDPKTLRSRLKETSRHRPP